MMCKESAWDGVFNGKEKTKPQIRNLSFEGKD
jgi:hypothetical protein